MKIRKIVIGIDENTFSEQTAEYGFEIARKFDAEVALVHIIMQFPLSPIAVPDLTGTTMQYETNYDLSEIKALQDTSNMQMDELVVKLGTGLHVTRYTETGPAPEILMDTAIKLKADLIVIGSHSRGGLERLLMGSTTDSIVHHSHIPVLIVPASVEAK